MREDELMRESTVEAVQAVLAEALTDRAQAATDAPEPSKDCKANSARNAPGESGVSGLAAARVLMSLGTPDLGRLPLLKQRAQAVRDSRANSKAHVLQVRAKCYAALDRAKANCTLTREDSDVLDNLYRIFYRGGKVNRPRGRYAAQQRGDGIPPKHTLSRQSKRERQQRLAEKCYSWLEFQYMGHDIAAGAERWIEFLEECIEMLTVLGKYNKPRGLYAMTRRQDGDDVANGERDTVVKEPSQSQNVENVCGEAPLNVGNVELWCSWQGDVQAGTPDLLEEELAKAMTGAGPTADSVPGEEKVSSGGCAVVRGAKSTTGNGGDMGEGMSAGCHAAVDV